MRIRGSGRAGSLISGSGGGGGSADGSAERVERVEYEFEMDLGGYH